LNNKLYAIRQLAKLCNVPIKTLRFYYKISLLKPEVRDDGNGYRYYSEKQLLHLLIIKELKPLGFSLDEIKELLGNNNLSLLKNKLENKMEEIQINLNHLKQQHETTLVTFNRIIKGLDVLGSYEENKKDIEQQNYYIELVIFPKTFVLYTRYASKYNANELFLERHAEIHKIKEEYGLFVCGSLMAVFHEHYTTQFFANSIDLEVLLPIVKGSSNCNVIKEVGGFLCASLIHVGSYPSLFFAYMELAEWINKNNYDICGPAIEQYIIGPTNTTKEENYITKVLLPVKEIPEKIY
jgi:DNA-binding transcriptional MerR regulator